MSSVVAEVPSQDVQSTPMRARRKLCLLRKAAMEKSIAKRKMKRRKITVVSKPARFPSYDDKGDHVAIYVGTGQHARNLPLLKELGIRAVLNCAPSVVKDPKVKYSRDSIAYAELDCNDVKGFPILKYLPKASKFIRNNHNKGNNVLVHCMSGVNRSATLVVAYILTRDKPPFLKLVEDCLERRPSILSNVDFQLKLCHLAHQHKLLR
jgi:hypothetical protein